jgi:SAM-dependent methyltransferase
MITCPVCDASDLRLILNRDRLPIFQNVVCNTRNEALNAPHAPFSLSTCAKCGFSFNSKFDATLIVYDPRYNNDIVSQVFEGYYRSLAKMLISKFDLHDGYVYDVGCGSSGKFIRILCEMSPGIQGVGIDPSCSSISDRNVTLIRGEFSPDYFDNKDVKLVLLRHVLDHIHKPVHFLTELRAAIGQTPLFVEVIDLDWIIDHRVFWDFCNEHCNYFTLDSLRVALSLASFEVLEQQRSFGDQYQWLICRSVASAPQLTLDGSGDVRRALAYAKFELSRLQETEHFARSRNGIALWGMSTKGVILSNLLNRELLRGGVDMNPVKQGRFAPVSGLEIHAPQWLRSSDAGSTVLVMNPNYRNEIATILERAGVEVELISL